MHPPPLSAHLVFYGLVVVFGSLYLFIPQQFMEWLGRFRRRTPDTSLPTLILMRLSGATAIAYGIYHLVHSKSS